jgi:DNA-binding MarR family transcriptional regulator
MADSPPRPLLGLLLRLAQQHWAQDIDAALAEAGFGDIRPPHANVFPFVGPDGIQVSELAQRARIRKQSMAEAVEQLEELGYVERRPDPHDRRARLVFLTPRGEAVRPVSLATGRRIEEQWGELVGKAEIATLRATLETLLASLSERGTTAQSAAPTAETS